MEAEPAATSADSDTAGATPQLETRLSGADLVRQVNLQMSKSFRFKKGELSKMLKVC